MEIKASIFTGFLEPRDFQIVSKTSYEMAIVKHIMEVGQTSPKGLKERLLPVLPFTTVEKLLNKLESKGKLVSGSRGYQAVESSETEEISIDNRAEGCLKVTFIRIGNTFYPLECEMVVEPYWKDKKPMYLPENYSAALTKRSIYLAKFGNCNIKKDSIDKEAVVRIEIHSQRIVLKYNEKSLAALDGVPIHSVFEHGFEFNNGTIKVLLDRISVELFQKPFEIKGVTLEDHYHGLLEPLRLVKIPQDLISARLAILYLLSIKGPKSVTFQELARKTWIEYEAKWGFGFEEVFPEGFPDYNRFVEEWG